VVPLDLVKCRLQVDPDKYKNIFNGFRVTVKEDGAMGTSIEALLNPDSNPLNPARTWDCFVVDSRASL
jgi:hypothetical protein